LIILTYIVHYFVVGGLKVGCQALNSDVVVQMLKFSFALRFGFSLEVQSSSLNGVLNSDDEPLSLKDNVLRLNGRPLRICRIGSRPGDRSELVLKC